MKLEAADLAQSINALTDSRVAELEEELHHCMTDRDMLQIRLQEAVRASGK